MKVQVLKYLILWNFKNNLKILLPFILEDFINFLIFIRIFLYVWASHICQIT